MTHLFHIEHIAKKRNGNGNGHGANGNGNGNGKMILEDVSLNISQGDIVGLLGADGAGKTTLIRCLMMLELIDRGRIDYGGHPIIECTNGTKREVHIRGERFRRRFGFVLPTRNLFPHRTVMQNVVEPGVHVSRQSRRQAYDSAQSVLGTVGMANKANERAYRLDRGEQQLVALARAFAADPEVVFLDEIETGLDPSMTARLYGHLKELHEAHDAAIVMATQHPRFAAEFSDLLCFLHEGRFAEKGSPKRLMNKPSSDAFIKYVEHVRASW